MAGDWFDENAPSQQQGDWFDQNKPQVSTVPAQSQVKPGAPDNRSLLKKAWDWTGQALAPVSKLTEPYLNKETIPIGIGYMGMPLTSFKGEPSQVNANPGVMHGIAKATESATSPRSMAMMALLGPLTKLGILGDINKLGLATDSAIRGGQAWSASGKTSNPNENTAGKTEAIIDWLTSLGFLKSAAGRNVPAGAKKPARMNFEPGKAKPTAPELPLPVGAAPRTAVSAAPSIPDIPLEAPKQPWYEMEQYKPKAKAVPAPSKPIPPWSRPAPTPEYFPGVGHVEPEVYPQVKGMIDNRMQAALDLFESGVGEVSRKGKNIEGIENMNYGAIDRADMGFGNVPVKRAFPELSGVKGSPKQIADAIRRDKNNPKYLQIRDAMTDAVFRENSDHIDNLNENAVVNREERLGLQGKFGDESGFADISRRKGRSVPGESVPFDDLTGQAWMMPDGSVVKVKDHWTAMEEFLGKDTASFKDAADQGMIRIRKAPRTLDVETFAPEATPEQRQTLLKYARENPDIALTWEGKNKDFQSKWGNDWDSLKKRLFGEEGFARVDKNQKGFEFRPMNVPGQSRTQVMQDLYNQILQAPDSNVSKRELLGMQTRKPVQAVSETPLFKESALQPVKPSPAELDKQFIDQYLGGRPLSEAVEANKQNYSPDLDMQMADQVLGKNWRFQR